MLLYLLFATFKKSTLGTESDKLHTDMNKLNSVLMGDSLQPPVFQALEDSKTVKVKTNDLEHLKSMMEKMHGNLTSLDGEMKDILEVIKGMKNDDKVSDRLDLSIIEVENKKNKESEK